MPDALVFSVTAGRTGTAFLAELLGANLAGVEAHHERMSWEAFGLHQPGPAISMRFNGLGWTDEVASFWRGKARGVLASPAAVYAETSHLLFKSGLIESLPTWAADRPVHLVHLTRARRPTVESFRKRFDFLTRGNRWMWYLDPEYPRNLVGFAEGLRQHGVDGMIVWYLLEVAVRAAVYRRVTADWPFVRWHEVALETLRTPQGAERFLDGLGLPRSGPLTIPPPANTSDGQALSEGARRRIAALCDAVEVDADALAEEALATGVGLTAAFEARFRGL